MSNIIESQVFIGELYIKASDHHRAVAAAVAAEREALEQVAQRELANTSALMSMPPKSSAAWNILQAIRARGQA